MLRMRAIQAEIDRLIKRNKSVHNTRRPFHDAMQEDLVQLAEQFEMVGTKEYRVPEPKGRIDVV
ncbi:hypothetical protein DVB69_06485 [Sporosarcina sp. BI001-red]|uniref:hypothetical protein n=1 Tax=Sporosarcina sp. BI001-red TaxID=2282866 RepID=UPI000E283B9E|nr:hypothetical protein [Sporosarcina sp. BI001-red]REB08766.1 hypothetical protein DVB69_06485 [Sporosarcina sp. BI001-red]